MRKLLMWCASITLMTPLSALAHHDERMLGHHWALADYTTEMRIQIAGMVVVSILCAAFLRAVRIVQRRRAQSSQ